MKWYKHDSSANMDAKLQLVILEYSAEGYGLYWYCLELIAANVDADNMSFELEHDARIIAKNLGMGVQRCEEIMKFMVKLGLFEAANGMITCMKLAKRADDYTAKLVRSQLSQAIDSIDNRQSPTKSDKVQLEENRIDKNRIENTDTPSGESSVDDVKASNVPYCPCPQIVDIYHDKCPTMPRVKILSDKRKKMIKARWKESSKHQTLEFWDGFFEYAGQSEFLKGEAKPEWVASFEWLINSSNFVKVIEGNYHRDRG